MKIVFPLRITRWRVPLFRYLAALSLCALSVLDTRAEVLWQENFSEVPLGPAIGQGPENIITEEGGLRFLSKKVSETEFYFIKLPGAVSPTSWTNILTKVRFRFMDKCTTTLAIKWGGERSDVAYGWYYVGLNEKQAGITCVNMPPDLATAYADDPRKLKTIAFNDTGFPDLPPGTWITASVSQGDEVVKLRLELEDGTSGEWEFKVFPGTGSPRLLLRSPTDIDEFIVEQLPNPVVSTP